MTSYIQLRMSCAECRSDFDYRDVARPAALLCPDCSCVLAVLHACAGLSSAPVLPTLSPIKRVSMRVSDWVGGGKRNNRKSSGRNAVTNPKRNRLKRQRLKKLIVAEPVVMPSFEE